MFNLIYNDIKLMFLLSYYYLIFATAVDFSNRYLAKPTAC